MSEPFPGGAGDPTVRAALAAACPDATPTGVEPLGRGNRKRTRLVRFADREPVVVQSSHREGALRTEGRVLAALRERTTVPVPEVLAEGTRDGVGYLVTAYVPGDDLHERFTGFAPPAQRRLARAFGRSLAEVHDAFTFEGYGELRATDGGDGEAGLRALAADWPAWLRSYGLAAVSRLPAAFDGIRDRLRAAVSRAGTGTAPGATLFPWDFRPGNALVVDGALAAVLDWEGPLAAPPALSVAKAEHLVADWYADDPDPLRAAFRAGYGSVRPVPGVGPAHRVAAVAASAIDSRGAVTNPGWPPAGEERSVAFHRQALLRALEGSEKANGTEDGEGAA